jgi:hypothetical protein
MRSLVAASLTIGLTLQGGGPAWAGVIYYTTQATFTAAASGLPTETFSALNPGSSVNTYASPLSNATNSGLLAGVTYISPGELASVGSAFGLSSIFLFDNVAGDHLDLIFSPDVHAASFDIATKGTSTNVTVSLFGSGGLLGNESLSGVPQSGTGVFLGITSDQVLTEIDLTAGSATNEFAGISNFSFGSIAASTGVPEPATLALFGAGIIGLGAMRRRKVRKSA